jgi:uncharacterized protein YdgA (DUF945 family)
VVVIIGLALIVGLAAPYWLGRQIEQKYTDYLDQLQYGGAISAKELDAMAKEVVAGSLQPMLELGVVRPEEGERYSLHLLLQDGQLLMNGEPGEWLLGQF